MSSLRSRFALLLVFSILGVFVLATSVTVFVTKQLEANRYTARAADQMQRVAALFRAARTGSAEVLAAAPAPGRVRDDLAGPLRDQLRRLESDLEVVVTKSAGASHPVASLKLEGGWLPVPMPENSPPPGVWIALAGWMGLVAIGTGVVGFFSARRLTRHLTMLEGVALSIGPDGLPAQLPEVGPAEVRATAVALNRMRASLKTAIESRMRLVAAAGHDLRTPLTRMRLRAEFLDAEERSRWLSDLDELDRIAESAIQLVREEVGQSMGEAVQLDDVVAHVCRELASSKFAVRMGGLDEATILASPLGLRRALRNLIINAATHGGGALVTVTSSGTTASVVIDDDGPGIPDEIMPCVFEPFFRADPARRQLIPGAGLGLAISKEIIERHGGSLRLRNRKARGLRQEAVFGVVSERAVPQGSRSPALVIGRGQLGEAG